MSVDVRIPTLGESVSEGVIVRWIKTDGEAVAEDDPLFELETDKASVEIPSPSAGVVRILKAEGETVQVGDVVARIEEGAAGRVAPRRPAEGAPVPSAPAPAAAPRPAPSPAPAAATATPTPVTPLSPATRRLVEEHRLDAGAIKGTGRGGRLTKGDVLAHLEQVESAETSAEAVPVQERAGEVTRAKDTTPALRLAPRPVAVEGAGAERRVPMTRLRQRIAERLVQGQQTAAILTTFNEVDMSAVMALRNRHKARFAEVHGVSLGFMSFFSRACVVALKAMPLINARIDGSDIVYPPWVHLGVAVSTERGLVVPIIHHADQMSFAAIEKEIERLAGLARQNKLGIEDLSGGTFTISNGGVFGSLLSTPLLNPPQSAILGMHKIEKRPVVVDDQIVVRPMMYLALSYDHRLIDGADAVTFLVRVKEAIEDPARMLLDL